MGEFYEMNALELREAIRKRQIGVEELTRAYLKRIDTYDQSRRLNTIAALDPSVIKLAQNMDNQKADRDLPLFGLSVLIKDNIDVKGFLTTAGSVALSDNLATTDAPIVRKLRENGALILGKTHLTEFANYTADNMRNGFSSGGGQVIHAYDPAKDPGGSSTGSGVAMSAGFCSLAVGTDTSFSIVGCAQKNGVTGFKPAFGSLSSQGIVPICHTLDTAGPITRTVGDVLLMYSAMREEGYGDVSPVEPEKIRIAVNTYHQDQIPEDHRSVWEAFFDRLRAAGAAVAAVEHPSYPEIEDIMCYEFRHDLECYLAGSGTSRKTLREILAYYDEDPEVRAPYGTAVLRDALEKASGRMDDPVYLAAMELRRQVRAQIMEELKEFDVCIMTGRSNVMHFTGLPSLTLPIGMADPASPVGVIMYGTDERKLLAAALTMERYCGKMTMPVL